MRPEDPRPPSYSRPALITTPHPAATKAGRDVLDAGGTAIEAAIAAGAVLTVVLPHFNGLGGDGVWLIADEEGRRTVLLGIGQAGENPPHHPSVVTPRGPNSAFTTACLVDSWGEALAYSSRHWGGTASFGRLLEPAIDLANEGFAPTTSQGFWLDYRREEWPTWPGFAEWFGNSCDGPPGERFRQPALGATLALLREEGPRGFYEGQLADRLVKGLREAGIALTRDDLTATRSRFVEPLSHAYYDYELLAPPAPTQGMTTLAIMAILEKLEIHRVAKDRADFYHLSVEAVKAAFLERGDIGDPRFSPDVAGRLLGKEALSDAAARIDPRRALPWGEEFRTGDTVYLGVCDAAGRSVSLLQSTYYDWGSGVVVGDTGILWQNRASAFDRSAGRANSPRPGALPFYTLNPGIALKDGRPTLLYGTQGADGQPQTLAQLLTRTLTFGMTPAAALRAPRFLLGRTFSDPASNLRLESDMGAQVIETLSRRGHRTVCLPPLSPLCGQAGLIDLGAVLRDDERAAHDPRG